MTRAFILILIGFSCLCHSIGASSPWVPDATSLAFIPRGGALGRGRSGRRKDIVESSDTPPLDENTTDASEEPKGEDDCFDLEEVNKQILQEEVEEIKESQKFLKKQQMRRELDKTWLDKGITSIIEFFENLFSWKVIDV